MFPAITPSQLVLLYGKAFSANTEPVVVKKNRESSSIYTEPGEPECEIFNKYTEPAVRDSVCSV